MELAKMFTSKTCVVVLGMHRSGTSALSGVMNLLGFTPGKSLLPAMDGINPKGFWEHAEIVSIHDELLTLLGSSWDDESLLPDQWWRSSLVAPIRARIISILQRDFGSAPAWLIKDPRMCRLLPMWHELLRELSCRPTYVIALRRPIEVARSLHKRNGITEEASSLLWLIHMLDAEFHTRDLPRVFVSYEELLKDWRSTAACIRQSLGLSWPVPIEDSADKIDAYLDSTLRHHVVTTDLPDHPIHSSAQKAYRLLSAQHPNRTKLDKLRAQTEELVRLVAPWTAQLRLKENQIRGLRHFESESVMLQNEIARIKHTVSWKITKPFRFIWNVVFDHHPPELPRL